MYYSKCRLVARFFVIVTVSLLATGTLKAQCGDQVCSYNSLFSCFDCIDGAGSNCTLLDGLCSDSCFQQMCPDLVGQHVSSLLPKGQLASLPASGKCANVSSLTLAKQASGMTDGMLFGLFTPVPGPTPLLISASFGHPTLFQKGVLLNSSAKTIVAYRIGWVYGYQDKAPVVDVSTWQNVIEGIKTNETRTISKLSAPTLPSAKGARLVQFFVAEVKFSDGTTWKQPLDKVREIGTAVRSQSVARSLPSSGTTGS